MIYILIATILFGVGDALWKPILEKFHLMSAMRARTVITTSFLILLTILFGSHKLGTTSDYLGALLPSCLSTVAFIFLIKAFKKSSVSVVITMNSFALIVSQIVSFILFKESINFLHYSLILSLIIVSIFLLNSGKLAITPGIKYALISSTLFGISYPLLSIPADSIGNFQTGAIQEIVLLIVILILYNNSENKSDTPFLTFIKTPEIVLVALFSAIGLTLLFYSYSVMPVYKVHLISSFVPIPALIFARVVYKEKLQNIQKVGVAISLFCTYMIATEFI